MLYFMLYSVTINFARADQVLCTGSTPWFLYRFHLISMFVRPSFGLAQENVSGLTASSSPEPPFHIISGRKGLRHGQLVPGVSLLPVPWSERGREEERSWERGCFTASGLGDEIEGVLPAMVPVLCTCALDSVKGFNRSEVP